MPTSSTISQNSIIAGFHALSEPLRIRVLELLQDRELCVCELCDILQVSQSKLSFHLKTLKEAHLVYFRQEGRWIYYSLNLAQFKLLKQYLEKYSNLSQILPASLCDPD